MSKAQAGFPQVVMIVEVSRTNREHIPALAKNASQKHTRTVPVGDLIGGYDRISFMKLVRPKPHNSALWTRRRQFP